MNIAIKWSNDSKSMTFPVTPESFSLSCSMNNSEVNVQNLGSVNLKGKRGLYSISWDGFFPKQAHGFEVATLKDSYKFYITKLKTLMEKNITVHLVISDTNINLYCTISSLAWGHDDGTGDVKYSIALTEYREVNADASRVTKSTKSTTVKWKKGDTWHALTKTVTGDSKTWKTQKANNKAVIKKASAAYRKKYPSAKTVPEATALIGYKVVIRP